MTARRIMHVISGLGTGGAENMLALLAIADAANVVLIGANGLGKTMLLEIREETRRRLGARFDLHDFHAALLASGSVPPPLLREELALREHALVRGHRGKGTEEAPDRGTLGSNDDDVGHGQSFS